MKNGNVTKASIYTETLVFPWSHLCLSPAFYLHFILDVSASTEIPVSLCKKEKKKWKKKSSDYREFRVEYSLRPSGCHNYSTTRNAY